MIIHFPHGSRRGAEGTQDAQYNLPLTPPLSLAYSTERRDRPVPLREHNNNICFGETYVWYSFHSPIVICMHTRWASWANRLSRSGVYDALPPSQRNCASLPGPPREHYGVGIWSCWLGYCHIYQPCTSNSNFSLGGAVYIRYTLRRYNTVQCRYCTAFAHGKIFTQIYSHESAFFGDVLYWYPSSTCCDT